MIAILIKTTDEISVVELEEDTLKAMQRAVGGFIEHVRPRYLRSPYCMIVNEEGLLRGMPINNAASLLYGGITPIVGDVLILKDGLNEYNEPDVIGLEEQEAASLVSQLANNMAFLTVKLWFEVGL